MKFFNNKPITLNESAINNINKAMQLCDQKIGGVEVGSNEWNEREEELTALYLEIGRNLVLDNFLPF